MKNWHYMVCGCRSGGWALLLDPVGFKLFSGVIRVLSSLYSGSLNNIPIFFPCNLVFHGISWYFWGISYTTIYAVGSQVNTAKRSRFSTSKGLVFRAKTSGLTTVLIDSTRLDRVTRPRGRCGRGRVEVRSVLASAPTAPTCGAWEE